MLREEQLEARVRRKMAIKCNVQNALEELQTSSK
jgi:hypothetical protein